MPNIDLTNGADTAHAARNGRPADDCGHATVRRSLTVNNLAKSLATATLKIKNPPKDSVNPHFKSKYADLATVRDAVAPALAEHGLCVVQLPCELGDHPALTTILMHSSGEFVETTVKLRPGKSDPQGIGSALTYMRRYCLQAVCGVAADDDDDGHAGSQGHAPGRQEQRPAPQQRHPQPAGPTPPTQVIMDYAEVPSRDVWEKINAYVRANEPFYKPHMTGLKRAKNEADARLVAAGL